MGPICQLRHDATIPAAVPACDTLCGQAGATPWHCVANSGTARPSLPLCRPATHCAGGSAPLRCLCCQLQSSSHDETLGRAWEHSQKGVRMLTGRGPRSELPLEITSGQAQESSRHPQKPELTVNSSRRPRIRKDDDPARCHAHQYAIAVGFTVQIACNCPSLTYKRKGQTPGYGQSRIDTAIAHATTPALSPRYWHFASISLAFRDLEASSPLPPCL